MCYISQWVEFSRVHNVFRGHGFIAQVPTSSQSAFPHLRLVLLQSNSGLSSRKFTSLCALHIHSSSSSCESSFGGIFLYIWNALKFWDFVAKFLSLSPELCALVRYFRQNRHTFQSDGKIYRPRPFLLLFLFSFRLKIVYTSDVFTLHCQIGLCLVYVAVGLSHKSIWLLQDLVC